MKVTDSTGKAGGRAARGKPGVSVSRPESPYSQDSIATAAYYNAEARSFSPGRELDDWLDAESELSSKDAK